MLGAGWNWWVLWNNIIGAFRIESKTKCLLIPIYAESVHSNWRLFYERFKLTSERKAELPINPTVAILTCRIGSKPYVSRKISDPDNTVNAFRIGFQFHLAHKRNQVRIKLTWNVLFIFCTYNFYYDFHSTCLDLLIKRDVIKCNVRFYNARSRWLGI